MRKIMWLLVNNIHTKISNELLFISCPSANAPPTCLWLVSKMTSLIDIHVHTYGKHAKSTISLKRASFQIAKQNFKSMLKEVWSQSLSSGMFSNWLDFRSRGWADSPGWRVLGWFSMNSTFVFILADMEIFNMMLQAKILNQEPQNRLY